MGRGRTRLRPGCDMRWRGVVGLTAAAAADLPTAASAWWACGAACACCCCSRQQENCAPEQTDTAASLSPCCRASSQLTPSTPAGPSLPLLLVPACCPAEDAPHPGPVLTAPSCGLPSAAVAGPGLEPALPAPAAAAAAAAGPTALPILLSSVGEAMAEGVVMLLVRDMHTASTASGPEPSAAAAACPLLLLNGPQLPLLRRPSAGTETPAGCCCCCNGGRSQHQPEPAGSAGSASTGFRASAWRAKTTATASGSTLSPNCCSSGAAACTASCQCATSTVLLLPLLPARVPAAAGLLASGSSCSARTAAASLACHISISTSPNTSVPGTPLLPLPLLPPAQGSPSVSASASASAAATGSPDTSAQRATRNASLCRTVTKPPDTTRPPS